MVGNNLANEFKIKKLGDLVNIKTGKLDANASTENGKYPFFTCSITTLRIDKYSYDCECVLVAGNGDLNIKYYKGKFDAYQRTYIVESKDKLYLDTKYLYYYMNNYIDILRNQSIGGVIKYIKLGNLTEAKIPVPKLVIQKKIVEVLEKAKNALEKKKEAINLLDELVKSRFIEMFGDPVINSKGWDKEKLNELGELARGKSKHRPRNAPELLNGPYPLIQTGDIANAGIYLKEYTQTYSELGLKQSKMWKKGILCITIAANIAKTSILTFDACFPDSVVAFIPSEKTNNMFIQFWMSFLQKILEDSAPESAQKNINLKILSEQNVIVPPIELQNEFADFVNEVDKLKFEMESSLKELEDNFNSLMQKAFKGELFK
ncbi:restriction endonuclease subunit S [Clostridium rectalis]|uniref:restriction endonuclease subunit S n=1 Tax=Clostridium rectalis TaxID=2040295 RepID=UPI000F632818|nr:restriction endonuclease subunit S [Clostridium rectalis]